MPSFSEIRDLVVTTFSEWNEDKAPRLAAALSYYTIFSLAPLLLIAISIAGLVFGEDAARGAISTQLSNLLGEQGASAVEEMLAASSRRAGSGITATLLGLVTLLLGAAGVFGQLQGALNTIWGVEPKPGRGIWGFIKDRFLAFTMVLGAGLLLLASLILSSVLSTFGGLLLGANLAQPLIWQSINLVIQALVAFGLFAMIFKVLPDVEIAWRDVMLGAAITTLLFLLGRFLIDLYLSNTATGSTFGAAGSLVVLLVWIFFSAQILFLGAEFTQVYARRYGAQIKPSANAVAVKPRQRAEPGLAEHEQLKAAVQAGEGEQPALRERAVGTAPLPPAAQQARKSPGATVIAAVTIFAIVGAMLRRVLQRQAS
jgi:membrane protein